LRDSGVIPESRLLIIREVEAMARNRYGWEKRAKELARKQKNEEKQKRRQGKTQTAPLEELPQPGIEEEQLRLDQAETLVPPGPKTDP
jgi:hypothetical protein